MILVGINTYPGHAYCRDAFLENLEKMKSFAKRFGLDVRVFVVWNGGRKPTMAGRIQEYVPPPNETPIEMLAKKQNIIRDEFLRGDYTHLFMLESDNLPPVTTLVDFYNHKKDAVSSVYFIQTQESAMVDASKLPAMEKIKEKYPDSNGKAMIVRNRLIPSVWGFFGNKARLWSVEDCLPQRGLVRAFGAGIGSVLLSREVVESSPFRIRGKDFEQQFTDFLFFKDIYDKGFSLYVDTNNFCQHLHYDWTDSVIEKWFDPQTLEKA